MQQYDAIILAGGRSPWLKEACGTEFRCLAPIKGRRMVDYILDAMLASGCVRRIVVAAKAEALAQLEGTLPDGVRMCEAKGDMPTTAYAATMALGEDSTQRHLYVCDDIPLLTPQGIQDFLEQCALYPEKHVFYPIIPKEACLKLFPEAQRTYGKLPEGEFTGGNIMLLDKNVTIHKQELGREIYALRKSPLRLANWLGWSFILKAVLRRLTLKAAEERVSQLLGPSKAIITDHAGIGMDVDKPSDLQLVEKYLNK
ncbi:MAG: NTP transferase domain-containing protein [Phascolarctobacterium sp.]